MTMKKYLFLGLAALTFAACNKDTGELTGVKNRSEWYPTQPLGMVYIPMGTYMMGSNDADITNSQTATPKQVSLPAFYMDQTEITNNEYRQFTNWVRDSILRYKLGEAAIEGYEFIEEDEFGNVLDEPRIDWSSDLEWDSEDEDFRAVLDEMYYPSNERFNGAKEVDSRKLMYKFFTINKRQAGALINQYDFKNQQYKDGGTVESREDIIIENEINIYPDTLAWMRDFTYSFNDPMHDSYFWHSAYDEYPVVGVNWHQAKAFSVWRTMKRNSYLGSKGKPFEQAYRLPTESEWEYAARGGNEMSPYPWGGPYIRNSRGCFLGNYKPLRGNYVEDGGFYTVKADAYWPNNYGLYCMAGNVAEWTTTAYDPQTYRFSDDLSPDMEYDAKESDPLALKRKVIRGGSWKDIGYYLQVSTRDYEYQDSAKSFVGFRCVQSFLGRSEKDFK